MNGLPGRRPTGPRRRPRTEITLTVNGREERLTVDNRSTLLAGGSAGTASWSVVQHLCHSRVVGSARQKVKELGVSRRLAIPLVPAVLSLM